MKRFLVSMVLCLVICLTGTSSFAKEISLGGTMIYSDSDISLEINFVKMEGDFCIVEVSGTHNGEKIPKKRKRVYAYRGEEYVNLTPHHKLTLFYAGTKGGQIYALLNGKAI